MLFKHGVVYLLSRGVPSLLNFLALSLYTRLVTPEEYGIYAISFASIMLLNTLFFQWLRLGLLRFLPKFTEKDDRNIFLNNIAFCYILSSLIFLFLFIITFSIYSYQTGGNYLLVLLLSSVILIVYGWFEATLELIRSSFNPAQYGRFFLLKTLLIISVTTFLCWVGFGEEGLLLGLLLGQILPLIYYSYRSWPRISLEVVDRQLIHEILKYGLPLSITALMNFMVNSSDRLLIGWMLSSAEAGLYSVGYEIAKQSLWILMLSVNLASFPLAVKALEEYGVKSATEQLRKNLLLLLGIAFPGFIGLSILSFEISYLLLGNEFSETATAIIPIVALGVLFAGFKSYYLDQSFQLGNRTYLQIWPVLVAAVVNITLNILWLPVYGIMGAAYATIVSYILATFLSFIIGQRVFLLPFPLKPIFKIFASGFIMGVALYFINIESIILSLIVKILVGLIIYFTILYLFRIKELNNFIENIIYDYKIT